MFVIAASSAGYHNGNSAVVAKDNVPIPCAPNEHHHDRGLHIVLVNPSDGKVEMAQVFDTYKTSETLEVFIGGMPALLRDGMIVIAACKDDCVMNLSVKAKSWFASMGSKEIGDLEYRQSFAFIGVVGGDDEAVERRGGGGQADQGEVSVTRIFHIPGETSITREENLGQNKAKEIELLQEALKNYSDGPAPVTQEAVESPEDSTEAQEESKAELAIASSEKTPISTPPASL